VLASTLDWRGGWIFLREMMPLSGMPSLELGTGSWSGMHIGLPLRIMAIRRQFDGYLNHHFVLCRLKVDGVSYRLLKS
jgi:hypothetical protein